MTRFSLLAATGALLTFTACSDPALEKRVADLEAKVAEHTEALAKGGAAAAGADDAQAAEQAAMELYRGANDKFKAGDNEGAKAALEQLMKEHGGTRVAQAGQRLLDQLEVVGKSVASLEIDEWYQGEVALADSTATLLVFWEVWCPHCKREVPKLEETFNSYKGKGLGVVGLTKQSRGKTPEDVKAFIAENNISYPIAKENGSMSELFGVSGVPAAAVVKGGKVVWRGHPAQLNDELINSWL